MPCVLLIGTLDTKGPETAYLRERIISLGCETLTMDSGILGEASVAADIGRAEVARAAGSTLEAIRSAGSRGKAVEEMLKGVRAIATRLYAEGRIHGVVSLGGAEGSVLAAAAMKALPLGLPKLIVSPIASGLRKFGPFVGTKDILVMHSVVDILGLNAISRLVFDNAAAAIAGMAGDYARRAAAGKAAEAGRKSIAATLLGNTTRPIQNRIKPGLEKAGYDLVLFHANGIGGRAMEELIGDGCFAGVLDYTLSEVAGFIAGGFHVGDPNRMSAAGDAGLPQVVVIGCLDFIVFGPKNEIPEKFSGRPTYYHNPEFTLVRLTDDEQLAAVRFVVGKLNAARGPVSVLFPLRGGSVMDNADGGKFWDARLSGACREELRASLDERIRFLEVDAHINDDVFADATLHEVLRVMEAG